MLKNRNEISSIIGWMRRLVKTQDIDPLYDGLNHWFSADYYQHQRFFIAYWMFYSVGVSWLISKFQGMQFWNMCRIAVSNVEDARNYVPALKRQPTAVRWPRAHERRHFRGTKAIQAVEYLADNFAEPESIIKWLVGDEAEFSRIMERAQKLPQFGPWIAFKVADMLERCSDIVIEPAPMELVMMYREPAEGLRLAADLSGLSQDEALEVIQDGLKDLIAPGGVRACMFQEIETCLCKWKSHQGGHYNIGDDIRSHRKELEMWGGQDLLAGYPPNIG